MMGMKAGAGKRLPRGDEPEKAGPPLIDPAEWTALKGICAP